MKFFTDKTVENDYLLIKIKDYIKMKEKGNDFSKWKEVLVDPGVYELTKGDEYSFITKKIINIPDFLDSLPENHYFTCDYPCDMNPLYTARFLDKSWTNANKYCNHPNYIVVVQYRLNHYFSFKEWFDKYNTFPFTSGIMGLGNLCRILQLTEYMKHTLDYAFKNTNAKRIHIYGLCLKAIPYAYKRAKQFGVELSVDSTKWTRAVNGDLKNECGISCKGKDRQKFFNEYIKTIRSRRMVVNGE